MLMAAIRLTYGLLSQSLLLALCTPFCSLGVSLASRLPAFGRNGLGRSAGGRHRVRCEKWLLRVAGAGENPRSYERGRFFFVDRVTNLAAVEARQGFAVGTTGGMIVGLSSSIPRRSFAAQPHLSCFLLSTSICPIFHHRASSIERPPSRILHEAYINAIESTSLHQRVHTFAHQYVPLLSSTDTAPSTIHNRVWLTS